ncbi:MAG TPA: hypothetical protein VJC05_03280 [Candidatus Andersenbacteria bacterium]|nr:hypothetical protein [Candidatus Andersenbacteria bacterium]
MATNPDSIFEKWVIRLIFLWGPFYGLYYILRMIWREITRRED